MISFPNAKINLGLHILKKRADGYHEIETCLYPIELCDVLEIVKSEEFSFQQTGLSIEGSPESNLILRAYHLLKSYHNLPPMSIHLHKTIPMGAGLGGGSSDAAFTLKMLNDLFDLQLEQNQLRILASQLGSDCPFFISNEPAIATGIGTMLRNIELDLSEYRIELRHTGVHVSTVEAYQQTTPKLAEPPLNQILDSPISNWTETLINDFEESVFHENPEILKAKNQLLDEGAIYASMTGSGSSIFGLFEKH